jgi:hypothetical protein
MSMIDRRTEKILGVLQDRGKGHCQTTDGGGRFKRRGVNEILNVF